MMWDHLLTLCRTIEPNKKEFHIVINAQKSIGAVMSTMFPMLSIENFIYFGHVSYLMLQIPPASSPSGGLSSEN
eukprot:1127837-Ditylum_brightwellii.AAC.1